MLITAFAGRMSPTLTTQAPKEGTTPGGTTGCSLGHAALQPAQSSSPRAAGRAERGRSAQRRAPLVPGGNVPLEAQRAANGAARLLEKGWLPPSRTAVPRRAEVPPLRGDRALRLAAVSGAGKDKVRRKPQALGRPARETLAGQGWQEEPPQVVGLVVLPTDSLGSRKPFWRAEARPAQGARLPAAQAQRDRAGAPRAQACGRGQPGAAPAPRSLVFPHTTPRDWGFPMACAEVVCSSKPIRCLLAFIMECQRVN